MKPLYKACGYSLAEDVTVEIAAKNFYYADQLELNDIKQMIAKFIFKHKSDVMDTDGWKEYILPDIELFQQLVKLF